MSLPEDRLLAHTPIDTFVTTIPHVCSLSQMIALYEFAEDRVLLTDMQQYLSIKSDYIKFFMTQEEAVNTIVFTKNVIGIRKHFQPFINCVGDLLNVEPRSLIMYSKDSSLPKDRPILYVQAGKDGTALTYSKGLGTIRLYNPTDTWILGHRNDLVVPRHTYIGSF